MGQSSRLTSVDRPKPKTSSALLERWSLGVPSVPVETDDHEAKDPVVVASNTKRHHKSLIVTSISHESQQTRKIPAILLSGCHVPSAIRDVLHEVALVAPRAGAQWASRRTEGWG